ncbi:MAG: hypothetical protein ACYC2T_15730 [Bacillota bacterium]
MADLTILQSIGEYLGVAVSGGLTWDIIKSGALRISFVSKIKSFFNHDDEKAQKYIKTLAEAQSLSTKRPFNDAKSVYEDQMGREFPHSLQEAIGTWLIENKDNLSIEINKMVIGKQEAKDSATITNIVKQINYGGGGK